MKWISVKDELPKETQDVLIFANDIVNSWTEVIGVYVCPEYGNVEFQFKDGENYPAIITHWAKIVLPHESGCADATEYLMSSPANAERLKKAIDNVENGKNIINRELLEDE